MFDTMTLTKVLGAFCGAFLVFLLGKFVAEQLYASGVPHHGDEVVQGYLIDTGGDEAPAEEETGASFEDVYASADPAKGERVFNKCKACHQLEKGANSTGPYLYGVVGREVDTAEGYTSYSGALEQVVDVWTPEHLNGFLENPAGYAPGTAMGFSGLKSVDDRANVIAYLATFGG